MKISILLITILGLALPAQAEIYKRVDSDGRIIYSNTPSPGAVKLNLEPITSVPMAKPRAASPTPANFPKVDGDTQRKRDDMRKKILEDEFKAEEAKLAEAKQALAEGENTRLGNEKNYQKYLDRIQQLKDDVTNHEKNLEELRKQLR